ncbi:hypothetical protein DERF_002164 [Dermatophagoides farinae]|uniref:Uncharacterized protein n=1 Tax=Dermatophagoides farinae TaxID=6954 RepID=A0A922LAC8_DERFA|nr:hypothetical protein DERF_002164 [Dermatophagoides farinae]
MDMERVDQYPSSSSSSLSTVALASYLDFAPRKSTNVNLENVSTITNIYLEPPTVETYIGPTRSTLICL